MRVNLPESCAKMAIVKNQTIRLPGLIDVHVHLREPGGTQKEDFSSGTKAAIAGGYTQILDMPNNTPPTTDLKSLNKKINLARDRIFCDLGFNFGGNAKSTKYFPKIYGKAFGLKVYMNQTTGNLLVDNDKDWELIFKSWEIDLPIMVHAEGETVETAIKFAKKYKRKLHVCHVSPDQLPFVSKAKKGGLKISCEVCPHHLFLNQKDEKKLGPLAIMKPRLLSEIEQKKLWDNLNKIDLISTDHAPHTLEEKFDQASPKFGVPGLETTIPLFFQAIKEKKITLERFTEMTSTNPRKIFKLPLQNDTNIVVDMANSFKISNLQLFTKCDWTPFKYLTGGATVKEVVIRGKLIFKNGKFINRPAGQVIYPQYINVQL